MDEYYKSDYNEYYDSLSDNTNLTRSTYELKSSVAELNDEISGISSMLTDLQGDFSLELSNSLNTIIADVNKMKTDVDSKLPDAIKSMEKLSISLKELKEKCEEYDLKKDEKEKEIQIRDSLDKTILDENGEEIDNPEYIEHCNKITELEGKIDSLVKEILQYVEESDNNINFIKDFNESIVELRLNLAAITYVQGGIDQDDIVNMSIEERQEFMNNLVNEMTKKYNEYKAAYEQFANIDENPSVEVQTTLAVFRALNSFGNGVTSSYDLNDIMSETNSVKKGFALIEFVKFIDESGVKDAVDAYFNKGLGWKESGLADIYTKNSNLTVDGAHYSEQYEDSFWAELQDKIFGDISREDRQRIGQQFNAGYKELVYDSEKFLENYRNTLNMGVAVKGLKELNNRVKYDAIASSDDFKNFDFTWKNEDDAYLEMYLNTYSEHLLDGLNSDERKMFEYLYRTEGEDAVKDYVSSLSDALNRKNGYVNAKDLYDSLHDGSNLGLDAAVDHVRTFGVGYFDGMGEFLDGFVDIVSPEYEYNAGDYAKMAFIELLYTSSEDYDRSLLRAYNVGDIMGQETIPSVISIVNPAVGKTVKTVSEVGNMIEDQLKSANLNGEDTSYISAFINATVTKGGYELVSAGIDSLELNKIAATLLKTTYKATSNSLFSGFSLDDSVNYTKEETASAFSDGALDAFSNLASSLHVPDGVVNLVKAQLKPYTDALASAAVDNAQFPMSVAYSEGTTAAIGKNLSYADLVLNSFMDSTFESGNTIAYPDYENNHSYINALNGYGNTNNNRITARPSPERTILM